MSARKLIERVHDLQRRTPDPADVHLLREVIRALQLADEIVVVLKQLTEKIK